MSFPFSFYFNHSLTSSCLRYKFFVASWMLLDFFFARLLLRVQFAMSFVVARRCFLEWMWNCVAVFQHAVVHIHVLIGKSILNAMTCRTFTCGFAVAVAVIPSRSSINFYRVLYFFFTFLFSLQLLKLSVVRVCRFAHCRDSFFLSFTW